jgi:hypothetical protein
MSTLEESYAYFEQLLLGDVKEADADLREALKDAYFAGASDMLRLTHEHGDDAKMGVVHDELDTYARAARDGLPR